MFQNVGMEPGTGRLLSFDNGGMKLYVSKFHLSEKWTLNCIDHDK